MSKKINIKKEIGLMKKALPRISRIRLDLGRLRGAFHPFGIYNPSFVKINSLYQEFYLLQKSISQYLRENGQCN
jgi:hypothetical protein